MNQQAQQFGRVIFIDERDKQAGISDYLEHHAMTDLAKEIVPFLRTASEQPFTVKLSRDERLTPMRPYHPRRGEPLSLKPPGREIVYRLTLTAVQFERMVMFRPTDPREMRMMQLIPTAAQELRQRVRRKLSGAIHYIRRLHQRAVQFCQSVEEQARWGN